MNRGVWKLLCATFGGLICCVVQEISAAPPVVFDPKWRIEQVDSEPNLVTPTGCCFDEHGRLFVIECNTHFAPEGYDRADHDRIYIYEDSTGDGKLDKRSLFYDDGQATMNIVYLGDGWLAVATRSDIKRMRDTDGDKNADEIETLLELRTEANYPHNGLGGLAFGQDGWLYVGQGENFGAEYRLVAADGSEQRGSGEGGGVFRLRPEGAELQRFATGFWNPFGICLDQAGRVWSVENDPDAMPPCRLLQVVEGGDYGFQFRFGRAGIHPLQAWNGELPGTLPMAAGTGEATCAVVEHADYLWVTSWGDNRIERYALSQKGAALQGNMEIVVQGDANFRPVGIAIAADGSIYVTDWVDRSYSVHGKGRLWRLELVDPNANPSLAYPASTADEILAAQLRSDTNLPVESRLDALGSTDVFIKQAAVTGLVNTGQFKQLTWSKLKNSDQRLGYLLTCRWQSLIDPHSLEDEQYNELLDKGLKDSNPSVTLTAVRWATERSAKQHLETIKAILSRPNLTPQLFDAVIASTAYLETGSASGGRRDPAIESVLIEYISDREKPASLQALAVRKLQPSATSPTAAELLSFLRERPSRSFGMEIVRLLAERGGSDTEQALAEIAAEETVDVETRADALASLASNAASHARLLNNLSLPRIPDILRIEARRIIDRGANRQTNKKPAPDDLAAWERLVGEGGNIESGRRVFARKSCVQCHAHSGRGASTGPDLTMFAATTTVSRLLESILLPDKEIGPLYVPYRILTIDGKVLTGLKLDGSGAGESMRFQAADGEQFAVAMNDIELLEPVPQSIMPSGLQDSMTVDEFRDLIAFLRAESDRSLDTGEGQK